MHGPKQGLDGFKGVITSKVSLGRRFDGELKRTNTTSSKGLRPIVKAFSRAPRNGDPGFFYGWRSFRPASAVIVSPSFFSTLSSKIP
ncbi:MAG: hypothetical protein PWQ57_1354 [Desulfovibrionales bacterium]|nr:hypothetical protein [Desulfovibrionales bacterium]